MSRTLIAVAFVLFTSACSRQDDSRHVTPKTDTTPAATPPASLEMGRAKSVTTFFITSHGPGRGGDLGGLAGADAHCQSLAKAEGSDDHTWRAYLSTQATSTTPAVNARDRIGAGPWYNALGDRIATNLRELHDGRNMIDAENAVTERGDTVSADRHAILTGSRPDGTAYPPTEDLTCHNGTSSGGGAARVGHHDGKTPTDWNSAESTRGCSQRNFETAGGEGLFYCFAID
jgi:hypothetical protein